MSDPYRVSAPERYLFLDNLFVDLGSVSMVTILSTGELRIRLVGGASADLVADLGAVILKALRAYRQEVFK
jgi:hypothetical protein